jgi:hypothetical protein
MLELLFFTTSFSCPEIMRHFQLICGCVFSSSFHNSFGGTDFSGFQIWSSRADSKKCMGRAEAKVGS